MINGTMGVGKTVTSKKLQNKLPNCVFLDGDWCWDSSPFIVTEETKDMVIKNIVYLLNSFFDISQSANYLCIELTTCIVALQGQFGGCNLDLLFFHNIGKTVKDRDI